MRRTYILMLVAIVLLNICFEKSTSRHITTITASLKELKNYSDYSTDPSSVYLSSREESADRSTPSYAALKNLIQSKRETENVTNGISHSSTEASMIVANPVTASEEENSRYVSDNLELGNSVRSSDSNFKKAATEGQHITTIEPDEITTKGDSSIETEDAEVGKTLNYIDASENLNLGIPDILPSTKRKNMTNISKKKLPFKLDFALKAGQNLFNLTKGRRFRFRSLNRTSTIELIQKILRLNESSIPFTRNKFKKNARLQDMINAKLNNENKNISDSAFLNETSAQTLNFETGRDDSRIGSSIQTSLNPTDSTESAETTYQTNLTSDSNYEEQIKNVSLEDTISYNERSSIDAGKNSPLPHQNDSPINAFTETTTKEMPINSLEYEKYDGMYATKVHEPATDNSKTSVDIDPTISTETTSEVHSTSGTTRASNLEGEILSESLEDHASTASFVEPTLIGDEKEAAQLYSTLYECTETTTGEIPIKNLTQLDELENKRSNSLHDSKTRMESSVTTASRIKESVDSTENSRSVDVTSLKPEIATAEFINLSFNVESSSVESTNSFGRSIPFYVTNPSMLEESGKLENTDGIERAHITNGLMLYTTEERDDGEMNESLNSTNSGEFIYKTTLTHDTTLDSNLEEENLSSSLKDNELPTTSNDDGKISSFSDQPFLNLNNFPETSTSSLEYKRPDNSALIYVSKTEIETAAGELGFAADQNKTLLEVDPTESNETTQKTNLPSNLEREILSEDNIFSTSYEPNLLDVGKKSFASSDQLILALNDSMETTSREIPINNTLYDNSTAFSTDSNEITSMENVSYSVEQSQVVNLSDKTDELMNITSLKSKITTEFAERESEIEMPIDEKLLESTSDENETTVYSEYDKVKMDDHIGTTTASILEPTAESLNLASDFTSQSAKSLFNFG